MWSTEPEDEDEDEEKELYSVQFIDPKQWVCRVRCQSKTDSGANQASVYGQQPAVSMRSQNKYGGSGYGEWGFVLGCHYKKLTRTKDQDIFDRQVPK